MLKNLSWNIIVNTDLGKFGMLLILGTCLISINCSNKLSRRGEIEATPVKIIHEGNQEYWCLGPEELTAVLQEADRCK